MALSFKPISSTETTVVVRITPSTSTYKFYRVFARVASDSSDVSCDTHVRYTTDADHYYVVRGLQPGTQYAIRVGYSETGTDNSYTWIGSAQYYTTKASSSNKATFLITGSTSTSISYDVTVNDDKGKYFWVRVWGPDGSELDTSSSMGIGKVSLLADASLEISGLRTGATYIIKIGTAEAANMQSNDEDDWTWTEAQQGATIANENASTQWYGHTIWYDADGGKLPFFPEVQVTGQQSSSAATYLTTRLKSSVPTKSGYTFGGWQYTAADIYSTGQNFTAYATQTYYVQHTLTAIWIDDSGGGSGESQTYGCTLFYDAGAGTLPFSPAYQIVSESSDTVITYLTATIQAGTPTRTGYVFSGWMLTDEYGGSLGIYQPGAEVTLYVTTEEADDDEWPLYYLDAVWSEEPSGYAWIYTTQGWRCAIPYIYYGGSWHTAVPWIYKSGSWHQTE